MAIEVSDGFGIVLRAIGLNHQILTFTNNVIKNSTLSKNSKSDHQNKQGRSTKLDGVEAEWRLDTHFFWCVESETTQRQGIPFLNTPR